ncbi:MAG: carboxypeptidase-like regulatory domain-containing protein [Acidobacteriota bacterium]|nr:carboxypeptidase-like regulatory domain-containing protein [Acidobacteriota bacterium]
MLTKLCLAMFLSCDFVVYLSAQSTDATVTGTISDSSGGSIPGVTVTSVNTKTGVIGTAKTNSAGVYLFAALEPGSYKLSAKHQGFQ